MGQNADANQIPDPSRFVGGSDEPIFRGGLPIGDAGRAAAIRAVADGEIDERAMTDEIASALEGADAGVLFERQLREATGRVMGGVAMPAGVRERVLAIASRAEHDGHANDDALTAGLEQRSAATRSPGFWSGGGARRLMGAAAAVLLIGFVGVFVMQMAKLGGGNGVGDDALAYRTNLARFVSGEHTRTLDDRVADAKYIYKGADDASVAMTTVLASTPVIPPCDGHTKFRGASPCGVPGKGPSAHMQFVLPGEAGEPGRTVSVFVKQDQGELPIEDNTTYRIDSEACNLSDVYICVWRRDGLLYTLVSEDSNAPMCASFLSQFGVAPPDPAHSL